MCGWGGGGGGRYLGGVLHLGQNHVGLVADQALQGAPLAGKPLRELVRLRRVVVPQVEHPQRLPAPLRLVHLPPTRAAAAVAAGTSETWGQL